MSINDQIADDLRTKDEEVVEAYMDLVQALSPGSNRHIKVEAFGRFQDTDPDKALEALELYILENQI